MSLVPCVLGIRERVPRGHRWARAHLSGRCWINCTCQDKAGDREGGTGDSSAAWPGEQPAGSTPGCCARRPPGGRFYLSKPGMAQIPSAHGTPAPLAALAGAFLGNVKTARDFLVTAVTPSWLGGGGQAAGCCPQQLLLPWVPSLERAGGAHPALLPTHLSTTQCQDPHLPPTLPPRLPGQIRNQATQPQPAATPRVPPPPVPKPQPGGRAPPECHPELSAGRRSCASPEHPACPHLTFAPPSREHPQRPTKPPHLRTTATPGCAATPGRAQRLHPHLPGL